MDAQSITQLTVYRSIGGQRIPFVVEIDAEMTVVADRQAITADQPSAVYSTANRPGIASDVLERYPDLDNPLFSAGVVSEGTLANGEKTKFYNPTQLDIAVATWATPGIIENPIPGTDDLRAEFFEAETTMRAAYANSGADCPACDLGSLIRQYRSKLFAGGHLDAVSFLTNGRA